ncbi:ATP-binding protein, partial [Actinomadura roseirufa]|uniref:ATP-binding protein n=1 Tax=Actinomadura roseirufa TaxID=2094049 RepID=UPI0013F1505E
MAPGSVARPPSAAAGVFVARTAELEALSGAFACAVDGGAATVLVGGEAGIGKTRLVAEFARRLPPGTRVVEGGCLEVGAGGLAYAPFVTALRSLVRDLGPERAAELIPGRGRRGLAYWLPVLGAPEGDPDPVHGRTWLFEDVLNLVEAAAAEGRPLVLVLEDLHWADPSSRELLVFLVRNLSVPGVLLVGTYRSTDLDDRHPLRPVLAGLTRSPRVRSIDPAPLGRAEVASLVAGRLGRDPAPAEAEEIHRLSEGNPLFVEALADSGVRGGTPVPLRDLLLSGFRALPDASRAVLHAASVACAWGGGLRHDFLTAVTELDDLVLEEALRPAMERGLLLPSEDGQGYVFRHALLQRAIYEDLLPSARTRLHLRCGAALREDPGLVPDGRAAAEEAAHWCTAGRRRHAFEALWRAAAAARAVHAHAEQARILVRLLGQWEGIQRAEQILGVDRVDVLHRAAEACLAAGEAALGVEVASEALALLDRAADPERAALLLELRSMLRHRTGDEALDDLRAGVALLPAASPARRRLMATLANRLFLVAELDAARAMAAEVLAESRTAGDARVRAWALVTLGSVAGLDGDLQEQRGRDPGHHDRQVGVQAHHDGE